MIKWIIKRSGIIGVCGVIPGAIVVVFYVIIGAIEDIVEPLSVDHILLVLVWCFYR